MALSPWVCVPLLGLLWCSSFCNGADNEHASSSGLHCDWNAAKRTMVTARAMATLFEEGFERIETGALLYKNQPKPGEQIAGNPNTVYGLVAFPRERVLIPPDYPVGSWTPPNGSKLPSNSLTGFVLQRQEALTFLLCLPPPVRYFGITAYVGQRLLPNQSYAGDGDAGVIQHHAVAEVSRALNYINLNTTAGVGGVDERKADPSKAFGSTALIVFASSRQVYEDIAAAYVRAGLPAHAANFYPISAQSVRLHDRSKTWDYDYPDLLTIISRASYFQNDTDGKAWTDHHWPAMFLRGPASKPGYLRSVPDQLLAQDETGDDSEVRLLPLIHRVMDAVIKNKTAGDSARVVRVEQLAAVPNDWRQREQCLTNASFIAAVDPLMMNGGCGFGTRDCRYGTSPALDTPFGSDQFFVLVGVMHESMQHCSYASVMLTSQKGYEQGNHTITFREVDGEGAPQAYLQAQGGGGGDDDDDDARHLYAVTLSRECGDDDPWCIQFSDHQFQPDDVVYWMERAYLQRSTGVGPSINEYVMSYVITFQHPPPSSSSSSPLPNQKQHHHHHHAGGLRHESRRDRKEEEPATNHVVPPPSSPPGMTSQSRRR